MEPFIILGGLLLAYMSILFLLSITLKNNGVADIGYGLGFLVIVLGALLLSDVHTSLGYALTVLVILWSLRLSIRIFRKNIGKPEDFRYRAWRESWGAFVYIRSFFQIYLLQGVIIALIASPIALFLLFPQDGVIFLGVLGICISICGLVLETVSDYQLDQFLKSPQRTLRIMKSGMWRYSRHPNYFGESLVWIGVGIGTITFNPVPLMSVLSPFLITFLLLRVSGVPLLEARWAGDPEWETYKARTSVFIPLPPRRE